jgi:hypothetical protein
MTHASGMPKRILQAAGSCPPQFARPRPFSAWQVGDAFNEADG